MKIPSIQQQFFEICGHETMYHAAKFINEIGFDRRESELLFTYGNSIFDNSLWHIINALVWLEKAYNEETEKDDKYKIKLSPPNKEKTEVHKHLDSIGIPIFSEIFTNVFSSFYISHWLDGYTFDFSSNQNFFLPREDPDYRLSKITSPVDEDIFDGSEDWLEDEDAIYPDGMIPFSCSNYPDTFHLLICNGQHKGSVASSYQIEEVRLYKSSITDALCFEIALILNSCLDRIISKQLPKELAYYFAEHLI